MSSKKIKELEQLLKAIERAAIAAVNQREYAIARILEDALEKVAQKIEGHRYNKRKK